MTLKELAVAILGLPSDKLDLPAGVWPPGGCPAAESVKVTGLGVTPAGAPVILTGKSPKKE